jgi:hypothetical protein
MRSKIDVIEIVKKLRRSNLSKALVRKRGKREEKKHACHAASGRKRHGYRRYPTPLGV